MLLPPGWDRGLSTAVVLGAGGGARAVVYALVTRQVGRIYVINRTKEKAQALRRNSGSAVQVAGWDETTGLLGDAGRLVNRTTLGTAGQPPLYLNLRCPASMVVAHIVYAPLVTDCWPRPARVDCVRPTDSACHCTRRFVVSSSGSELDQR